jgi:hypothetical protein
MDQDSTDGNDKRNWRERLGIGAKDGLPRAADSFKEPAAARPTAGSARLAPSSVKPAPMAPRMAPRANPTAAAPARPPVGQPDALASKLRAQREAAEKLAEQRVNAARQRPDTSGNEPARPKFSFADPDAPRAQPGAQTNPAGSSPAVPKFTAPSQQPARQQLGQGAGFKPLPPAVPPSYAQQPPQRSFTPQPQQPQAPTYQRQYTQPAYPQQPAYRPVDPNTGYAPPPGYVSPQQRSNNYTPPAYPPQPAARVPAPTRGGSSPYQSVQPDLRSSPRLGSGGAMRSPPQMGYEDDQDDIFEQPAAPAGRRATANDYQQAYRNAEPAYEDDLPRSRLPLILMILLVLALASGIGGIWAYNNLIKGTTSTSADNAAAPVVAAPTQPAKVNPDTSAKADQSAPPAAGSNKKQIYDRIIGDREVLSGEMKANEEAPVQPDANAAPPAPGDQPSAGTGDNGMPLPLPPPPGSSGGTQGSLEQNNGSKVAQNTTAAEPSSAALSTGGGLPTPTATPPKLAPVAEPPVPSSQPSKLATADNAANTITDQPDPIPTKPVEPKLAEAKKAVTAKSEKNLGAKPVVLVPPAGDVASAEPSIAPIAQAPAGSINSLYNGPAVGTGVQATNPAVIPAPAPVPAKRKTLSDLFKSSSATPAPQTAVQTAPAAPTAPVANAAPTGATGFVAQLTTFKTKPEASAEYTRLVQKHGAIISKYAPIIVSAEVAGSPRFRLNIGPMPTMEVATNVCSSLFAAGERDCVVHRQ